MLRKQPREKERRLTQMPDDLLESLREAWQQIQESEFDPDVRVDYGDAIQTGNLCGGKVGDQKWPFEFTYYHHEDGKKARWHLAFHPLEIEDIADGHMTDVLLYCCNTLGCGFKTRDPDVSCDCDYVDDPHFGTVDFPLAQEMLNYWGITGIDSSSTRTEVVSQLGEPTEVGGDLVHESIGYIHPWIKYQRQDCQLRFEFGKKGTIRNVSVMEADWEPGK